MNNRSILFLFIIQYGLFVHAMDSSGDLSLLTPVQKAERLCKRVQSYILQPTRNSLQELAEIQKLLKAGADPEFTVAIPCMNNECQDLHECTCKRLVNLISDEVKKISNLQNLYQTKNLVHAYYSANEATARSIRLAIGESFVTASDGKVAEYLSQGQHIASGHVAKRINEIRRALEGPSESPRRILGGKKSRSEGAWNFVTLENIGMVGVVVVALYLTKNQWLSLGYRRK